MLGLEERKAHMVRLTTPIPVDTLLSLRVGQQVLINGVIYTARDRLHRFMLHGMSEKGEMPFNIEGGVLYHCGPVVKQTGDSFTVVAAGPTTSSRMDIYEPETIRRHGLRAIMGKGGMGDNTLKAMRENRCVYLNTINGAAVYLAERVKGIVGVWKLEEFGDAEAMWALDVEDFPAIVTMDAHGDSLHSQIRDLSEKVLIGMIQNQQ